MSLRILCIALACALVTGNARATLRSLVVEPPPTQTFVLATASGVAKTAARDVAVTVVAGSRDAEQIARILPSYDATSAWIRVAPRISHARAARLSRDASTIDPAATQFVLVVAWPKEATLTAFVERLETRFAREGRNAQVWSVVARARDCAALDARALDFARAAAASDAREIARSAAREIAKSVASENVTPESDDPEAIARRCALGTPRTPLRRIDVAALTDTSALVASDARIAIAYATTSIARISKTSMEDDASAPPLYGATHAATRLRIDGDRLGSTIAVVGTSARMRPADIVRYAWTSPEGRIDATAALGALERARIRLLALGIPPSSIAARVRSGPTLQINLFVDVPVSSRITGDAIVAAIAGGDQRIRASIGESYVRLRCDAFEARAAREADASARFRAEDLARALGTSPRAPFAIASRGVVAPRCTARDTYAPAAPRGTVVGGPQQPVVVATYASVIAAYTLSTVPTIAPPLRNAPSEGAPPEDYFRIAKAPRSEVGIVLARARAPLTAEGIATRHAPAERAELNIAIAGDRAHRFANVDPLRAYALAAPLERVAARAPTRVVVEPSRVGLLAYGVALHLDLHAPLGAAAQGLLRALLDGARRLGTTNVQLVFESTQTAQSEAAARRAALSDVLAAANREASVRHVRLERLISIVEAEPYIERSAARDPRRLADQRVALVVRIDATFATKPLSRPGVDRFRPKLPKGR